MSAGSVAGIVAKRVSVEESMTSIVSRPIGVTHAPSM